MSYYVGILDGAKDVWGVRIPDVPGCYGAGATPEAAIADATSALREVAAHWAAKGIDLKPPRSMQAVLNDPAARLDCDAGESLVMVPLLLDQARSVKANISLDAGLLEVIDDEAKLHGLTRSSYLASAALDKIVHRTAGDKQRKGAVKARSQVKNPIAGTWTKGNNKSARKKTTGSASSSRRRKDKTWK